MSLGSLANSPITNLPGVGPKLAEKLANLHLHSIEDVLFHLPFRYQDRTRIYPIFDLIPDIYATISGTIDKADIVFGKRRMLTCRVSDGSGTLTLRFFNFNASQKNQMLAGRHITAFGEVKRGRNGWEIIHPEYKISDDHSQPNVEEAMTPIYPATEGVKQATLRKLSDAALKLLKLNNITELVPYALTDNGMTLTDAILLLHRPPPDVSLEQLENGQHPAQKRLAFEELLAHNLSMLVTRQQAQNHQAIAYPKADKLNDQFLATLPFAPTQAQQRVVNEIQADMIKDHPMMRLVQGDVGSGKTLVAALASLSVLARGHQVALMAPTEILAEQHALNFANWLTPLGIKVDWLAGKLTAKQKTQAIERLQSGETQLVVGTHALFQDKVEFNQLSLIIVDEQHRFGVEQRLSLREKGQKNGFAPHQLIMTATPIPRTLAMTAYADLTTSVIDELPPGRTPVSTVVIPNTRRDEIIQRVRNACLQENRQAYWVCTLIEESESLQCQAAEDTAELLKQQLPELSIGLVHGRMKAGEKQQVMDEFKQGNMHLLVATTVIEVGVDVPNSSLMIIENPERLGLAQLHQLRGRVGRGATASHCVLMYNNPLSKVAQQRLAVMRESTDGFYIAEKDLEIRGPGELLGTKQTGTMQFKIADLIRDSQLIPKVREAAPSMLQQFPEQSHALIKRWIGERTIYNNA
ncbi:ATP-dependent DNA helicase RecG [Saccharobesus litoralis]|uniref:ATP-dependent DNA helicase RecG n=1 Tax=Saccharobesus litoralis TaxID=2172099 RepID=A0A2S0VRG0_9ALTE|nr:ATP-dependent DNA helicase RecG [Saccharobesus litoralis]AWB66807.1 ATP-dependent DNA helicase RecG [Saccharobesus litoralis]